MNYYKIRGRVKSLMLQFEDECFPSIKFNFSDSINIGDNRYGVAYDDDINKTEASIRKNKMAEAKLLNEEAIFTSSNCIFNLISQHSDKQMFITFKDFLDESAYFTIVKVEIING